MSKSYKLGLTRNRLFDFEATVSFIGEIKDDFSLKELQKALKMLSVKEPLITSKIELQENGDACLITDAHEPQVQFVEGDVKTLVSNKRLEGINFLEKLFEFYVVNKNTLVVFSHIVVSDVKSLFVLAGELIQYYNKESVSVEPNEIRIFSSDDELPLEAKSFVADRVTEVLDNDWLLKEKQFSFDDLKNARDKYLKNGEKSESYDFLIDNTIVEERLSRAEELKIDLSSMMAFAFFTALRENTRLKKKEQKINATLDRRLYFCDKEKYVVGPFDAEILIDAPKKNVDFTNGVINFHKDYYQKYSIPFNAFYNEYFLSRLSPDFLDSAYMYKAGLYKSKPTKKLSDLYFCGRKFLMGFSFYNLKQSSWSLLSTFHHKIAFLPHKMINCASVTIILGDENVLHLDIKKSLLVGGDANKVFERFLEILKII